MIVTIKINWKILIIIQHKKMIFLLLLIHQNQIKKKYFLNKTIYWILKKFNKRSKKLIIFLKKFQWKNKLQIAKIKINNKKENCLI